MSAASPAPSRARPRLASLIPPPTRPNTHCSVQTILVSFVVGTLFLQEDKGLQLNADGQPDVAASIASANYFLGVILFTVFQFGVSAFPDSAMLVQSLPVWYKHRDRWGRACAAGRGLGSMPAEGPSARRHLLLPWTGPSLCYPPCMY